MDKEQGNNERLLSQQSDVLNKVTSFRYSEELKNVMVRDVYTCKDSDLTASVAAEMSQRRISSAVVVNKEGRISGIVTERDMVQKVVAAGCQLHEQLISDIMTPDPVYLSPEDTLFDALALLSRRSIKHLPIVSGDKVAGIITLRQLLKIELSEPLVMIGLLEEAETIRDLKEVKDSLVGMVKNKLAMNYDPVDLVAMVSLLNADIHKRLFIKSLKEEGDAPADYCLFISGSHGRRENFLFPDQDYGLIIEDYEDERHNEVDQFFIRTCIRFSKYLDEVGFEFCSGNVMGTNPTWRKRAKEWQAHMSYMFWKEVPNTVRYLTLIFDSAYLYGNKALFSGMQDYAFGKISEHHNILRQLHEEEGGHRVPLGLFDRFLTERKGEHRGELDMKRSGLIFIIEAVRILAVKTGIRATSTLDRLKGLVEEGVINRNDSEYFESSYRFILKQTLTAQVENFLRKGSNEYYLNPSDLSARGREVLKRSFKAITKLQELVGSEFGELIM